MSQRGINIRLSAESIQDEGVKAWARDVESRMDQLHDENAELRDVDDEQQKGITRNLKFLIVTIIVFGSAFAVVVALFGIPQIIEKIFHGST